ncbi:MAG: AAA family ATPase [Clostridiaceae bacterium]|nr:AAA family ATPase [Clostridiaceae bacterium]
MRLEKLEVRGFGKLKSLSVSLINGVNIIYGCNEAGKTTLQWFIKGMLYGLKSGRQKLNGPAGPQKRFRPWDGTSYGGVLIYTLDDDRSFRVERNFDSGEVRLFDSSYEDITASFEIGRDKLPLFAEQHMGMDERTFERTAFIRQMKLRLDEDSSAALASKLSNVSATGFEEISLNNAEKALSDALKNYIGTSRTRIQPLDKLEARLKHLEREQDRLGKQQRGRLKAQEGMLEAQSMRTSLEMQESYLRHISGLIDIRKELDANLKKEAQLKETARRMRELESELSGKIEKELSQGQSSGLMTGRSGRRRTIAAPILCLVAEVLFATLLAYSFFSTAIKSSWLVLLVYAVCLVLSSLAGVFFLRRWSRAKIDLNSDLELHQGQEPARNQTHARQSFAQQGQVVRSYSSSVAPELRKICLKLEELSAKLERGIDAALQFNNRRGFFNTDSLEIKIYDSDIESLDEAWGIEMEQVKADLLQAAMREKYCEGLLRDDGEYGDELQRVEEETVAVKEKITYLKYKRSALLLAHDVLMEAGQEIRRTFAPDINNSMSTIISGLTAGRYTDLRGSDRLSLMATAPEDGNVKNALELSGATADQMYLALRLAMAHVLSSGAESVPIIMDEAFSQFDDNRTKLALEYLHRVYDRQIILFTCKQREVELAYEIFGDSMNLIELGCEIPEHT